MPQPDSIYLPRLAEITGKEPLTARETLFTVRMADGSPLGHAPGQFVSVSVFGVGEAPISLASSPARPGKTFELCIRAAGSVTGALHRLPAGSTIGIRGPFGRGFPVEEFRGHDLVIIAGGLGLAPLRSLIGYVLDRRDGFGALTLLYGARTPADMLFVTEMEGWKRARDFKVETTVDLADGAWSGRVGAITRLVDRLDTDPPRTFAALVGPPVMFRFVLKSLMLKGIYESRVYLSLERRMKCGVGKCGHCQVDDVYVCQKGPVFPYTRLRRLKEAL